MNYLRGVKKSGASKPAMIPLDGPYGYLYMEGIICICLVSVVQFHSIRMAR